MSDRVSILLAEFPDIPTWEWLEELATRELAKEGSISNGHTTHRLRQSYQCMHCGKSSISHMGVARHHKMMHVNGDHTCTNISPLENICIQRNK